MQRTDAGALLWSERFEVDRGDWAWLRDVSRRTAAALESRLDKSVLQLAALDARSGDAVDEWMRGDYLLHHVISHADLLQARRHLEAALAADPKSLHALSTLAFTHFGEVNYRRSPDRKQSQKARTFATVARRRRAIRTRNSAAPSAAPRPARR